MVDNIDKLLEREEKIDILVQKVEVMDNMSTSFLGKVQFNVVNSNFVGQRNKKLGKMEIL